MIELPQVEHIPRAEEVHVVFDDLVVPLHQQELEKVLIDDIVALAGDGVYEAVFGAVEIRGGENRSR